jgi:hypothetical protein
VNLDNIVAASVLFVAVVLFIISGVCIAVGAWWWSKAVRETQTARFHADQADEYRWSARQAEQAIEEAQQGPPARATLDKPTDDELLDIIRRQRFADMDDITTEGNEGVAPSPIGADSRGMYR